MIDIFEEGYMPFYLYKRIKEDGKECFKVDKSISLAGYNVIYSLWNKQGKPINKGWHIDIDTLINDITSGKGNYKTHAIIIDLMPSNKYEINLMELLDIWAYPEGKKEKISWIPLMLRIREIYYYWDSKGNIQNRQSILDKFCNPEYSDDIFEFLYLQGEDRGWNWGRVGQVNGALIYKDARNYFKMHF